MRKLVTIQEIKLINPIPNADTIEIAQILGWKVVVKKGEFKVGDLCVYCEIDSFLPIKPEFEFLRRSSYKKMVNENGEDCEGFRLRTIKLLGQISQGLILPLDVLSINTQWHINELKKSSIVFHELADSPIGLDVTDELGVVKYETPIPAELSGNAKGGFPSFMIKTDEDRIQILPHIPEKYGGENFVETEKLDGSSCSFYWNNGEFGVCGRNYEYYESPSNSMWKFARTNKLEEKLRDYGRNLGIQGEIIGEGIQKNKYKIKGQVVKVFRMFDIDKYVFLSYNEMVDIVENVLNITTVPILNWNYILPSSVDEIIEHANGKSILNPLTEREGVVFVKADNNYHGRLSFKAISNHFLIKNSE